MYKRQVLRRLLRRSIWSMRLLGVESKMLPTLLPVPACLMSRSYPAIGQLPDEALIGNHEAEGFKG